MLLAQATGNIAPLRDALNAAGTVPSADRSGAPGRRDATSSPPSTQPSGSRRRRSSAFAR